MKLDILVFDIFISILISIIIIISTFILAKYIKKIFEINKILYKLIFIYIS